MVGRLIQTAKSAYQYPLIFKQLWHTPLVQAPDQEVVYRDLKRFTYRQIRERIGRLASALSKAGVVPGDTVGVLEWDSHRFLEAFFAIPMMGAVLQTVNVRLSPEQIAYTIDHAGASTLLVNDDFVGLLEGLKAQLPKIKRLIVMSDRPAPQTGSLSFVGEYESLLAAASPDYDFPDFDENTQATTFYTTGTTGLPKGVAGAAARRVRKTSAYRRGSETKQEENQRHHNKSTGREIWRRAFTRLSKWSAPVPNPGKKPRLQPSIELRRR
jgi:fatty-acyl-CoA synthase